MSTWQRLGAFALAIIMFVVSPGETLASAIRLPSKLEKIESEAFAGDTAIEEVEVPWGVTFIGRRAFASSSAKKIYLPASVSYIAEDAFDNTGITICASEGSYAKQFADDHGISWEDCDDRYDADMNTTLDEMKDDDYSLAEIDFSLDELIPTEYTSDPELLAMINEYNSLIEEENALTEKFSQSIGKFGDGFDSFEESLGASFTEGSSASTYSVGGLTMSIDSSLLDGSFGAITSTIYDEDGGYYIYTTTSGRTVYSQVSGNGVRLTSRVPSAAASSRAISDAALEEFKTLIGNLNSAANSLTEIITANVELATRRVELAQSAVDLCKQRMQYATEDFYRRYATMVLPEKEAKLKDCERDLSRLSKISKVFAALNVFGALANLSIIADNWTTISTIRDHDHPTQLDLTYPDSVDVYRKMHLDIVYLREAYIADGLATALTLIEAVATLASLASVGGAFIAVPGWIAAATTFGISLALSHVEDQYLTNIKDADHYLHTYIYGWVKNQENEKPLENVGITDGKLAARTDANGYYEMHMEPGTSTVVFKLDGYKTEHEDIVLNAGESRRVDMAMAYGAEIYGTARDASGTAVSGVSISVGDATTLTDGSGNYSIVVDSGTYTLWAYREGYREYTEEVTVKVGDKYPLDITLHNMSLILTREDLENISRDANGDYYLGADIDLSDAEWIPNVWFGGTLDGCGHAIKGMSISSSNEGNAGLFLGLYGGTVYNLKLEDVNIDVPGDTAFKCVGGLAGNMTNHSTVHDVSVYGSISVTDTQGVNTYIGGITGLAREGVLIYRAYSYVTEKVQAKVGGNYVFAGGLAGKVEDGQVSYSSASGKMTISQTGSDSSASFFACGTAFFEADQAVLCNADMQIELTTTNGSGSVYGTYHSNYSDNYASLSAETASGTVSVIGCYWGDNNINHGEITARATAGGTANAIGVANLSAGSNLGGVTATASSGTISATGAQMVTGKVINSGTVFASSQNGNATAGGLTGNGKPAGCVNSGNVSAYSANGSAYAFGLSGCGADSNNSGAIHAESEKGSVIAQGMSQCTYSRNTGNVDAIYNGKDNASGSLSCQGLNYCTNSVNNASISAQVNATTTACTVTGATGGSGNAVYGTVQAISKSGPANARGVMESKSQNYADIYACSSSSTVAASSNATAYGVGSGSNSLNAGTVTAVSKSSVAYAYGVASNGNGNVSTGMVEAIAEYFVVRQSGGITEGELGRAYAYNSNQCRATVYNYTVSATGDTHKELYYFTAVCEDHKGQERHFVIYNKGTTGLDGCYVPCGSAYAYTYDDYVMPIN